MSRLFKSVLLTVSVLMSLLVGACDFETTIPSAGKTNVESDTQNAATAATTAPAAPTASAAPAAPATPIYDLVLTDRNYVTNVQASWYRIDDYGQCVQYTELDAPQGTPDSVFCNGAISVRAHRPDKK